MKERAVRLLLEQQGRMPVELYTPALSMARPTLPALRRELRALASPDHASALQWFFKTGPGGYGEGDRFLGVRMPALRRLARANRELATDDALTLLRSRWHEERLLALLLLIEHYRRADAAGKDAIHRAYLANTRYVNNWDLVDASAEHLVGAHLARGDSALIDRLSASESVWERRIAMIATFHWIKRGEFALALRVAERLVHDRHDLIHKAVGWMLRETGKRDREVEERFLGVHAPTMPRTMLRYAIERFPEPLRRRYMLRDAAPSTRRAPTPRARRSRPPRA